MWIRANNSYFNEGWLIRNSYLLACFSHTYTLYFWDNIKEIGVCMTQSSYWRWMVCFLYFELYRHLIIFFILMIWYIWYQYWFHNVCVRNNDECFSQTSTVLPMVCGNNCLFLDGFYLIFLAYVCNVMLFQPALLWVVIHWKVILAYAFYFISKGVNNIVTKKAWMADKSCKDI